MCLWAALASKSFSKVASKTLAFLTTNLGWLYLISMLAFVIFAIAIAFSKYGNIKLGTDDSKPEYSTTSWFAMLFGAGMGIGLIFWGVADFAIKSSFLHWGIHPWAGYSIIGLSLAYFQFRKGKSGLISSILEPILGDKVNGPIGVSIDVLAVFETIAGIATSLGLGTMQINSGLSYLFNIPNNSGTQIIIAITTFIFIATAVSGVDKGIKKISDINLILAIIVTVAAFLVGPTLEIINNFTSGIGNYVQNIFSDSMGSICWNIYS